MSAAPDLYECLREAIEQTCLYCRSKACKRMGENGAAPACIVMDKWMKAIKKAGG